MGVSMQNDGLCRAVKEHFVSSCPLTPLQSLEMDRSGQRPRLYLTPEELTVRRVALQEIEGWGVDNGGGVDAEGITPSSRKLLERLALTTRSSGARYRFSAGPSERQQLLKAIFDESCRRELDKIIGEVESIPEVVWGIFSIELPRRIAAAMTFHPQPPRVVALFLAIVVSYYMTVWSCRVSVFPALLLEHLYEAQALPRLITYTPAFIVQAGSWVVSVRDRIFGVIEPVGEICGRLDLACCLTWDDEYMHLPPGVRDFLARTRRIRSCLLPMKMDYMLFCFCMENMEVLFPYILQGVSSSASCLASIAWRAEQHKREALRSRAYDIWMAQHQIPLRS